MWKIEYLLWLNCLESQTVCRLVRLWSVSLSPRFQSMYTHFKNIFWGKEIIKKRLFFTWKSSPARANKRGDLVNLGGVEPPFADNQTKIPYPKPLTHHTKKSQDWVRVRTIFIDFLIIEIQVISTHPLMKSCVRSWIH